MIKRFFNKGFLDWKTSGESENRVSSNGLVADPRSRDELSISAHWDMSGVKETATSNLQIMVASPLSPPPSAIALYHQLQNCKSDGDKLSQCRVKGKNLRSSLNPRTSFSDCTSALDDVMKQTKVMKSEHCKDREIQKFEKRNKICTHVSTGASQRCCSHYRYSLCWLYLSNSQARLLITGTIFLTSRVP